MVLGCRNKLQASDNRGNLMAVHYKSLTPSHFVPPLLHIMIGMVNQAWEYFQKWTDDYVEKLMGMKKMARDSVGKAKKAWQKGANK
jgi:hypothetical protein